MRRPGRHLGCLPTPVTEVSLPDTTDDRDLPLLLKRDDLTGFGVAGNKVRALEFLMDQADATGCTTVVGGGTPKSNFVAALALAAMVTGRSCELLISASPSAPDSATIALARAWGAQVTVRDCPRDQLDQLVVEHAAMLSRSGSAALAVPRGGATPVGALGFAWAAQELRDQVGVEPLTIVLPVGSGASAAGLAAGAALIGAPWRLVGVSVSRAPAEIAAVVDSLARDAASLLGGPPPRPVELVDARDAGEAADHAAARLLLESCGVLLDPVYGVRSLPVAARLARDEPVLLWLTGGLPSALDLTRRSASAGVSR